MSRSPRSSPRSTTAGSPPASRSSATAFPSWPRARARSTTRWTSRSTTSPIRTGSSSTTCLGPDTGPCCYDTVVSESRIADYIGTAKGELPRKTYYGRWRTFPDSCEYSLSQETRPSGFNRIYDRRRGLRGQLPVPVDAARPELGRLDVRGPDAGAVRARGSWGSGSWRQNHPLTVDAQIDHGLNVAGYGVWGFSPSNIPEGGYAVCTGSTPSAWIGTAIRRTRTARS